MENELQQEKKWKFISLFLIIILIILVIILFITGFYLFAFYNKYNECYANEKNHTTVITTLDTQLKQCREYAKNEQKLCKEDILEIKTQRDTLNTELEKFRSNSVDCNAQLEYCRLHYHNCNKQLKEEQTARKNLEKILNNLTLECSKAQKICELNIRSVKHEHADCEIRAKDKAKCQEDLHECNRKTCFII